MYDVTESREKRPHIKTGEEQTKVHTSWAESGILGDRGSDWNWALSRLSKGNPTSTTDWPNRIKTWHLNKSCIIQGRKQTNKPKNAPNSPMWNKMGTIGEWPEGEVSWKWSTIESRGAKVRRLISIDREAGIKKVVNCLIKLCKISIFAKSPTTDYRQFHKIQLSMDSTHQDRNKINDRGHRRTIIE